MFFQKRVLAVLAERVQNGISLIFVFQYRAIGAALYFAYQYKLLTLAGIERPTRGGRRLPVSLFHIESK